MNIFAKNKPAPLPRDQVSDAPPASIARADEARHFAKNAPTPLRPGAIYTRTGDRGTTQLGGNRRINKDAQRVQALGEIDELNCQIGLIDAFCIDDELKEITQEVQQQLLDLGAELARPNTSRITAGHTHFLERVIDQLDAQLPPLQHFILPGGTAPAAQCQVARAVCRRAERSLFRLSRTEQVNVASLQYVNRLSDLLFVLARTINRRSGEAEIVWKPGSQ